MPRVLFAFLLCAAAASPAAAQITRVSVSTAGVEANGASFNPSISADGRFVVFESGATNLVADDTNGLNDVFLRDRDVDADGIFDEPGQVSTIRVLLGSQTTEILRPVISANGRYVFFSALAAGLGPQAQQPYVIYRWDRQTTTAIPVLSDLPASWALSVTADGDAVVTTRFRDIVLREITADRTTVLPAPYTVDPFPHNPGLPYVAYDQPTISADGARITYITGRFYSGFVPPQEPRLHLYERATGVTTDLAIPFTASFFGTTATLSASGRTLVFGSAPDVVRHVIDTGAAVEGFPEQVTAPTVAAASPSQRLVLGTNGVLFDFTLGVSRDLGFVPLTAAFSTDDRWLVAASATNTLLPGNADTNGQHDIFVFDLPDLLDADDDTMDDRWETLFGVTDPNADPDTDGQTNAQEEDAGTHPNGLVRRFLAEGATGAFFHTAIALANPGPAATAVLTFDRGDGTRVRMPIAIPAGRSAVVDVGAVTGVETADVSTTVESDRLLGVQRSMTWGASPASPYGSHAETATAAPSATWFLAEGSTVLGFDLFYLLQNPQPTTTHTTVRFLLPSGTVVNRTYDLPPGSRTTIYVNQVAGLDETDVSGDITADAPIVVERAMYRSAPGQPFALGTDSLGVPAASTSWFLAEGATGTFFDLYVLIANPGDSNATVQALYAKPDGSTVTRTYTVRAHSRFSVYVDDVPGLENTSVATTLTSTNAVPIVAERAMYWPGGFFDYYEGHTSAGSPTTALQWVVAGAESGGADGAQTFVLIANTENRAGVARIDLLPDVVVASPPVPPPPGSFVLDLPPNSRTTVPVTMAGSYGVRVTSSGTSPVQLVVESAVYRSAGGVTWSSGSNALATPLP